MEQVEVTDIEITKPFIPSSIKKATHDPQIVLPVTSKITSLSCVIAGTAASTTSTLLVPIQARACILAPISPSPLSAPIMLELVGARHTARILLVVVLKDRPRCGADGGLVCVCSSLHGSVELDGFYGLVGGYVSYLVAPSPFRSEG